MLTQIVEPSGTRTYVQIFDNGVLLKGGILGGGNKVDIVGLYQNGVEVGTVYSYNQYIGYEGYRVLAIGHASVNSGYTFYIQLHQQGTHPPLPNGNYDLIVRYYEYNSQIGKYLVGTYTVPLIVAVP